MLCSGLNTRCLIAAKALNLCLSLKLHDLLYLWILVYPNFIIFLPIQKKIIARAKLFLYFVSSYQTEHLLYDNFTYLALSIRYLALICQGQIVIFGQFPQITSHIWPWFVTDILLPLVGNNGGSRIIFEEHLLTPR